VVCNECRHVRHHQCRGRDSGCLCFQCWSGAVVADAARRARESNSTQLLRASLNDMIALHLQKQRRVRKAIYSAGTINFGTCLCGCGEQVYGSPIGRRKLYVSHAHEMRAFRRRKARQARIGVAVGGLSPEGRACPRKGHIYRPVCAGHAVCP
jgi:hypothetical protein